MELFYLLTIIGFKFILEDGRQFSGHFTLKTINLKFSILKLQIPTTLSNLDTLNTLSIKMNMQFKIESEFNPYWRSTSSYKTT